MSYSFEDIASVLSELSGEKNIYTDADPKAFLELLKNSGIPEMYNDISKAFSLAIKNEDFDVQSNDLESLLGRKPTDLKGYLSLAFFRKS